MSTRQIHIFISHSWSYSKHYDTLSDWIFNENWRFEEVSLDLRDFSVPKNDPIHNASNDTQLKEAIYNKISNSHVVVIPTGMYANYSKWIKKELEGSAYYKKPVLAVNPWAQERKSSVVQQKATKLVSWNKKSVINEIWNLYK